MRLYRFEALQQFCQPCAEGLELRRICDARSTEPDPIELLAEDLDYARERNIEENLRRLEKTILDNTPRRTLVCPRSSGRDRVRELETKRRAYEQLGVGTSRDDAPAWLRFVQWAAPAWLRFVQWADRQATLDDLNRKFLETRRAASADCATTCRRAARRTR